MTTRADLSLQGRVVEPSANVRALADALVERWAARGTGPDLDPWLSLWSYDLSRGRLLGQWSASARSARRLDAWARAEVLRHLSPAPDSPAPDSPIADGRPGAPSRGSVLVWGRTGRPEIRAEDLAWYAALATVRPCLDRREDAGHADPLLLVVTRGGWVTVPYGVVGRRSSRRRRDGSA